MKPQFNDKIRYIMLDFDDSIEKPDVFIYGSVADRILYNISRVVEIRVGEDLKDEYKQRVYENTRYRP